MNNRPAYYTPLDGEIRERIREEVLSLTKKAMKEFQPSTMKEFEEAFNRLSNEATENEFSYLFRIHVLVTPDFPVFDSTVGFTATERKTGRDIHAYLDDSLRIIYNEDRANYAEYRTDGIEEFLSDLVDDLENFQY